MTTDYQYDGFDRLTSTLYSNEPTNTPSVTLTYDRISRKLTCTQGTGANQNLTTYTYDPATLLLVEENCSYANGSLQRSIVRAYDNFLRPSQVELMNSTTQEHYQSYGYGDEGRLTSVTSGAGSFGYQYDPAARILLTQVVGPAHVVNLNYESNRDIITARSNERSSDGSVISAYAYTSDNIGRRSQVTQTGDVFSESQSIDWAYNTKDEVISATHSTDSSQNRGYQFDAIGNRQSATESGTTTTYTTNAQNAYTTIDSLSPNHDADGNATEMPLPADTSANAQLIWDGENRLIGIIKSDGAVINYQYDAQSRRIRVTQLGGEDYWTLYDNWNVIAEVDAATNPAQTRATYTWGKDLSGTMQGAGGVGGLLAVTEGSGASSYPLYDGNGNVTEYIDESGTVVAHYEYDPFGNSVVESGSRAGDFRYQFSTKVRDEGTRLYYYGYRYYDPNNGRWINRDPIGERGGVNLYGFVENATLNYLDYLGLENVESAPHLFEKMVTGVFVSYVYANIKIKGNVSYNRSKGDCDSAPTISGISIAIIDSVMSDTIGVSSKLVGTVGTELKLTLSSPSVVSTEERKKHSGGGYITTVKVKVTATYTSTYGVGKSASRVTTEDFTFTLTADCDCPKSNGSE